jgi:Cu/Ag efflux pump CusA
VVSLGTVLGLLSVAVLACRHALWLLGGFSERRADGETPGQDMVRRVVREQLGPLVVSGLAVALTLLPIVLVGPIAGLELLHPMAVVVLGGLVGAAVLNLAVLPGLYAARAGRQEEDLGLAPPMLREEKIELTATATPA